jgi:acetyl-CoA acyltransferase
MAGEALIVEAARTPVGRRCGMLAGWRASTLGGSAALAAGFPETVIAAGVESMTRVPMWSNTPDREAVYGSRFRERYGLGDDGFIDQGLSGEIIAEKWEITRAEVNGGAIPRPSRVSSA